MQTNVYSAQRVLELFKVLPKFLLACNSVTRHQGWFPRFEENPSSLCESAEKPLSSLSLHIIVWRVQVQVLHIDSVRQVLLSKTDGEPYRDRLCPLMSNPASRARKVEHSTRLDMPVLYVLDTLSSSTVRHKSTP